jgi:hypothetical protein
VHLSIRRVACSVVMLAGLAATAPASAVTVDLSLVLTNSGWELGNTSSWTATMPNTQYISPVPVDPANQPLDPCCSNGTLLPALTAPAGLHFVGVATDPDTVDEKGKLVHTALSQSFAADTIFQVTIWANRSRLNTNGNTNSAMPAAPPTLSVGFYGWGTGALPTVTAATDNWSRTRSYNPTALQFTNWGAPAQWTSQTFQWAPGIALSYISLGIAGMNNNHDQYIAWDMAPVPEPSTALLVALGLAGFAVARRSPRA